MDTMGTGFVFLRKPLLPSGPHGWRMIRDSCARLGLLRDWTGQSVWSLGNFLMGSGDSLGLLVLPTLHPESEE